jgi:hypothetical protein
MRAAGAKKSLSRQIQEENQAVRGGKAPEKRKRVQNDLVQSEVAQEQAPEGDDVQLHDQDEMQEERYLHVDLDAEGAEHAVLEEAKKKGTLMSSLLLRRQLSTRFCQAFTASPWRI